MRIMSRPADYPQTVGAPDAGGARRLARSRSTRAGLRGSAGILELDAEVTSGNGELRRRVRSSPHDLTHEQGVFSMCSSCHGDAGGLTIDLARAIPLRLLVGVAGAWGSVTSGDRPPAGCGFGSKRSTASHRCPLRRPERRDAGACRPMDRRRLTRCLPFIRLNEPARRSS